MAATGFYLIKDIRICERNAVDKLGLTEDELMARAGQATFAALQTFYREVHSIAVFCGGGNNAGDAYVLAYLARQHGLAVTIYQYKSIENLPPAARHAAVTAIAAGIPCQYIEDPIEDNIELIVDGLLGIGVQGEVKGPIAQAINHINDSGLPVLAIDVPSGLDADTGRIFGTCVRATVTVTFIARKFGLYTLNGPDFCGKIICDSLKLEPCLAKIPAICALNKQLLTGIVARPRNSHKGMFGHVLVIGGGPGMPGAVYLAALAALKIGAGMVTVATWPEHAGKVLPLLPEAMIYGVADANDLMPLLARASICIVGPGLGDNAWAKALFATVIAAQLPLVIDASALHMLAQNPQYDDNWILTPHPGEAAALLACTATEIQNNRLKAAEHIQQQYGGQIVLKGAGTVVCTSADKVYLCTAGNPGMASAGMGDVLSGVLGGLIAQGLTLQEAAKLGVWLHAYAADRAVHEKGERGLLASDLMPYLRQLINSR